MEGGDIEELKKRKRRKRQQMGGKKYQHQSSFLNRTRNERPNYGGKGRKM